MGSSLTFILVIIVGLGSILGQNRPGYRPGAPPHYFPHPDRYDSQSHPHRSSHEENRRAVPPITNSRVNNLGPRLNDPIPCQPGYDGEHCLQCLQCRSKKCYEANEYCLDGRCTNTELLPPLCQKRLASPFTWNVSDTTAVAYQSVEIPQDQKSNCRVRLSVKGNDGRQPSTFDMELGATGDPLTYNILIPNLQPGTLYKLQSSVEIKLPTSIPIVIHSPEYNFTTTGEAPSPRVAQPPKVRDVRVTYSSADEVRLDWNTTPENVEQIVYYIKIEAERMSGGENPGTTIPPFTTSVKNATIRALSPYNNYTALVFAYSKTTKMHGAAGKVVFQTNATAPSAVKNLRILDADADKHVIYLTWGPPDPANGEIESYRVRAVNDDETAKKKFLFSKEKTQYEVTLPSNVNANPIEIQVYAVNKGVPEPGAISDVCFNPFWWFQELGRPLNFTAQSVGHGMVNLEWAHPSNSFVEITKFYIEIKINKTNLLEPNKTKIPIIEHPAKKKEKVYFRCLDLQTSTSYEIYLTASTSNNSKSPPVGKYVSVSDGYAFAGVKKLRVVKNGTLLEIRVPKVENATQNKNVSIIFKGFAKCGTTRQQSEPKEWVLQDYQPVRNRPKTFTFNPDKMIGENCFPNLEKMYEIKAVIKNDSGVVDNLDWSSSALKQDEKQSLTWLIIFPIIIIILIGAVLVYIWYRKRDDTNVAVIYGNVLEPVNINSTYETLRNSSSRQSSTPPTSVCNTTIDNRVSAHLYAVPFISKSESVSTKCFEEYVKEAAFNGNLYSQFATFPRGLTKPCDYGRLPENMPKNRDKNLIAYDETRVILDKIPGDPFSDYINANYINGYGEDKAYIATQGPKANTVNDFWRMIWQKGVRVICMLTNVMEDGEKMCEQYWPEVGYELQYGDIRVSNTDHAVFADFTFRTFELNFKQETRKVNHLHYTGWPVYGIPTYSQSLVTYLKKLVETLDGHGPVVIHCSSGDGRTGTIILCDMCVRQGIIEGEIDVPTVLERICKSRANMVRNPQQYFLAHVIITDSIMCIPTQVPCTEILPAKIKSLRKQLSSHIKRLKDTTWQERAFHKFAKSNKMPELVQVSNNMIENDYYGCLSSDSNYIGAVSVDGVRIKNQFLSSKLPSTSDLPNIWRFIAEKNIELVIILQKPNPNDTMVSDFLPGDSILVPVQYIQVETRSTVNEGELFTIDKLTLNDTSEAIARSQPVTVLTCNGWVSGKEAKPPSVATLVSLWQASENIPRKEGLTLVLCRDGVTGCGLYLALSFLLERMAVERECDVISAVRAVRRSRPEFVQRPEQFDYLYDAALNYVESFETYANFS